jgi:hypothetical protein
MTPFLSSAFGDAAYDPITQAGYLFGGQGSVATDVWRFEEGLWQPVFPSGPQPPPLANPTIASWPGVGVLVVVAGQTWRWNGQWQNLAPSVSAPSGLLGVTFDPVHNEFLALCTASSSTHTWAFDGNQWSLRTTAWPATLPAQLAMARLAFDANAQRVAAIATYYQFSFSLHWDGANWNLFTSSGAQRGFSLAPTPTGGLLVSGGFLFPFYLGETKLWDGQQWLVTPGRPPFHSVSYAWLDSTRQRTVIVSGGFGSWEWDGSVWSQPPAGVGPTAVNTTCYDSWRGELLQLGGANFVQSSDLWLRNGSGAWRMVPSTPPHPAPRRSHACAFDSRRGRMVIIGGSTLALGGGSPSPVDLNFTWEWDGATWHMIAGPLQPTSPYNLDEATMAYDPLLDRCVLFGGIARQYGSGTATPRNDTYEWNGSVWQQRQPVMVPPIAGPNVRAVMNFDPALGGCVLAIGDTRFVWLGGNWVVVPTPPVPGTMPTLGFDRAREVWVAAAWNGGFELRNGQWVAIPLAAAHSFDLARGAFVVLGSGHWYEIGDPAAARLEPFGSACPGSGGRPVLHGERPFRVGTSRTVSLSQVLAPTAFVGVLGADQGQFAGLALPLDLGPLGMPQCVLHTPIAATLGVVGMDWTIVVPAAPQLVGAAVRLQAFVVDALANPAALVSSNGLRVRIGV